MRVLFIGNSHTYFNDMPAQFARMCREMSGEEPELQMLAYSGRSLRWHREEYFSLRFALLRGGFDYCVLQQQAHPFPGEEETERALLQILPLCEKAGTKPVLFMTWAEKAKPENADVMSRCYRHLAEKYGALLAPIGQLFERFRGTEIELYWKDGEHASPYGSYLTAATLAATSAGERGWSAFRTGAATLRSALKGRMASPGRRRTCRRRRSCWSRRRPLPCGTRCGRR